jgi:hypothetical protein
LQYLGAYQEQGIYNEWNKVNFSLNMKEEYRSQESLYPNKLVKKYQSGQAIIWREFKYLCLFNVGETKKSGNACNVYAAHPWEDL